MGSITFVVTQNSGTHEGKRHGATMGGTQQWQHNGCGNTKWRNGGAYGVYDVYDVYDVYVYVYVYVCMCIYCFKAVQVTRIQQKS